MLRLSAEGCKARRERLIARTQADLLVITNPRHIQYLTGLFITPLALSGWGQNYLLIDTSTGHSTLIVQNMLGGDAKSAHVDDLEIWTWYNAATHAGVPIFREGLKVLNQALDKRSFSKAGIEFGSFPYGANVSEVLDITADLLDLRRKKDPDELELIQASIKAIEAGHKATREAIQAGMTEVEVSNVMLSAIANSAGHMIVPLGDFASGDRANRGGGMPTERVLQAGELMILDIFPIINGYKGDFTVTLAVDKKLTEKQQALETALLSAMAVGESLLKPGTIAGDVHRAIKGELGKHGFGEGFRHHAGHGLGLGHPEAPYFVPESTEVIQAGDVVTLEPGSYNVDEQYGARIERNYLVTDDGFTTLTHHDVRFA